MIQYLLLTFYTVVIIFLAWKIWAKTRSFFFILGIFMLYYWSLLGAWFIIYDNLTNNAGIKFGLHYYYFFEKMFPLKADNVYILSTFLYALFIIVIELTLLRFVKSETRKEPERKVSINHFTLLLGCLVLMLISICIVWKEILYAASVNQSVYTITRGVSNPLFPLHQICNNILVSGLFFGLIIYLCGKNGKYTTSASNGKLGLLYLLAVVVFEGYMLFLGNKKEIFFSGMSSLLLFAVNIPLRKAALKAATLILIILTPLFFNDAIRSYSPRFLLNYFNVPDLVYNPPKTVEYTQFSMSNATFTFLFSNEMFAAHFSMYGAIRYKVPLTYGKSVLSLVVSLVPKFILPNRPQDVYEHYATSVHANPDQGYTIHHATAWYLNFWYFGVILGAFLLGRLWAWFYMIFCHPSDRGKFFTIVSIFSICAFSAGIPVLIRSGIEAYKVVAFELILLPCLFFYLSSFSIAQLVTLKFLRKKNE